MLVFYVFFFNKTVSYCLTRSIKIVLTELTNNLKSRKEKQSTNTYPNAKMGYNID